MADFVNRSQSLSVFSSQSGSASAVEAVTTDEKRQRREGT